jgi:hypothetical protein
MPRGRAVDAIRLYLAGISIRAAQRCRYRCEVANGAVDAGYKQSKQTYHLDIYLYIWFARVPTSLSSTTAFHVVSTYYWAAQVE